MTAGGSQRPRDSAPGPAEWLARAPALSALGLTRGCPACRGGLASGHRLSLGHGVCSSAFVWFCSCDETQKIFFIVKNKKMMALPGDTLGFLFSQTKDGEYGNA